METTHTNPKTELLLGAGLNVLHFESKEWLENLAFWKDETRFFEDLLSKKTPITEQQKEHADMLRELDQIHKDLFEDFQQVIMKHERKLSKIENGDQQISDSNFREEHRKIKERITTFENNFRSFKKIVFSFAKSL
ncbi:hypothetical protein [Mangrovimonas sp. DI 80]|uniref:hypothetical protein n=1 Tax=Mangrovimonas sp. DI 80 TaxID=1779330 RepID=UPI0009762AEE|nr:hypothetical protein [Mangrovimonas sp. DI 80]OMP31498.1 hypothetical protein BKM32_07205 [Mangrovimonas sp. DI 80]